MADDKTAEEIAAEEREAAIARGDMLENDESEGEVLASDESEEEIEDNETLEAADEDEDSGDNVDESDSGSEEDKPVMIPKARFDEAQKKARAKQQELEEKLNQAETAQQQKQVSADVKELRDAIETMQDEYEDLLFEGENEKARKLRKEIAAKQEELFDTRLAAQNRQTQANTLEQIRYDTQLAKVEADYAQLNPDSPDFEEDLAKEVGEMMGAWQGQGYTATAALQKAVHYVMGEPGKKGEDRSQGLRTSRAVKARKKNIDANGKQPPNLADVGRNSDTAGVDDDGLPDVTKLSEKAFAKLTDAQLAKLRGDHFAGE